MTKYVRNLTQSEFEDYFNKVVTGRERQVLEFLVNNYNCAEIANHLETSKTTIISHVNNLFQKLQCTDRKGITELLLKNKIYIIKRNY